MNGSSTLTSSGVSTSAGILGWHIPAIPCDAVLRYKTHRCIAKKLFSVSYRHTAQQQRAGAGAGAATGRAAAAAAQAE